MKTLILTTALAVYACISFAQHLTITLYNKTDNRVEEFTIGNKLFGTLHRDEKVEKVPLNSFSSSDKLTGYVRGNYLGGPFIKCWTGSSIPITEGDLVFDLIIIQTSDTQFLTLQAHSE